MFFSCIASLYQVEPIRTAGVSPAVALYLGRVNRLPLWFQYLGIRPAQHGQPNSYPCHTKNGALDGLLLSSMGHAAGVRRGRLDSQTPAAADAAIRRPDRAFHIGLEFKTGTAIGMWIGHTIAVAIHSMLRGEFLCITSPADAGTRHSINWPPA